MADDFDNGGDAGATGRRATLEQQERLRPNGAAESEAQRLDRNVNELLQELRVAQTGVQILFAFLLTLPFTQRFGRVGTFDRGIYFAALLLAAVAIALFIAPVPFHRLLFRKQEKERLVLAGNRMALVGLACLALAINSVVLLITHFLFGAVPAAIVTVCMAACFGYLWCAIPLRRRVRDDSARGDRRR